MITNPTQLEATVYQLNRFREMLEAMRLHLEKTNPSLFPSLSEGYLKRIKSLEDEIIQYSSREIAETPLTLSIAGPTIESGVIKVGLASKLISAFQTALNQIAGQIESPHDNINIMEGLRSQIGLNLVATSPGSFIFAMDLESRQLIREWDMGILAIEKLLQHANELEENHEAYTGNRSVLRGLRKIASIVNIKKGVKVIEVTYRENNGNNSIRKASFTSIVRDHIDYLLGAPKEGEKTIEGMLIEINIENNTCKIHPEGQTPVNCDYEELLENDLIAALKQNIQMAGQFIPLDWPPGHFKITKIERFKVINAEEDFED